MKHVLACGQALAWVFLACLAVTVARADWTTQRETSYDWACCADAQCTTVISAHQREGKAQEACSNLTLQDGKTRYVQGGRYRISKTVVGPAGSATLNWTAPIKNTDGTLATTTAYRIHYGFKADQLIQAVQVGPVTTYTFNGLAPGTYYFAVRAISSTVAESDLSNVASRIVG